MKRRDFLSQCTAATAGATLAGCSHRAARSSSTSKRPPNIVFFFIDDMGWRDLGCMGSEFYSTPNIDRLSRQGMTFTNAYANAPNCAPTRACLLSGQYTPRHGVYTVGSSARKPDNKRKLVPVTNNQTLATDNLTFMEALKPAGYASVSIGKWHLGATPETLPTGQGFDQNIGGTHSGSPNGGYFPPYKNKNLSDGPEGEYLTNRLTDDAVAFIETNKDRPFFLYLSHYAVHTPIQAKPEIAQKYERKPPRHGQENADYAAMIESVDDSVGRVLETLDQLGLSGDTVVVFTSDNGGHGCITSNQPLHGAKGMLYEGGIRVPAMVRWPGKTQPGSVCDTPIISIDFYPTFLELAGLSAPEGKILDGQSITPLLAQTGTLKRGSLFWHFPAYLEQYSCNDGPWRTTPVSVIRKGDWKLLEFFEPEGTPNRLELYDLKNDLSETTDLAKHEPDKTRELLDDLRAWRDSVNAPVPTQADPNYEPDGFNMRL
ncbi:MAG: sulfatase [Candidatus Hinthialibacter antarcticus]|nr:sulfatase [Candidatus Hinthialibacter antarcticus]